MTALTADRTDQRIVSPRLLEAKPVGATARIWSGAMVAMNATANLVPATADNTLNIIGVAETRADNATGADGDLSVAIDTANRPMANSTAGDLITAAHIRQTCYVVDDQTVALTDAGGTRPAAGVIADVWIDGRVIVQFI